MYFINSTCLACIHVFLLFCLYSCILLVFVYFAFAPALLVFMYFCRFARREAVLYLKKNKLRILTKTEKVKCEESAPDRSSTDIVLCSGNGAEYLRYLHGLTQPVVFLMSSYRNWPTLSYKSSSILKQSAAVI